MRGPFLCVTGHPAALDGACAGHGFPGEAGQDEVGLTVRAVIPARRTTADLEPGLRLSGDQRPEAPGAREAPWGRSVTGP